uniref:Pentatricopeptide repeat-containing protein n=1 Tax=Rhizophora mucronata TaxID=61149 RepID=A0A2P2P122_RHIMU
MASMLHGNQTAQNTDTFTSLPLSSPSRSAT